MAIRKSYDTVYDVLPISRQSSTR